MDWSTSHLFYGDALEGVSCRWQRQRLAPHTLALAAAVVLRG